MKERLCVKGGQHAALLTDSSIDISCALHDHQLLMGCCRLTFHDVVEFKEHEMPTMYSSEVSNKQKGWNKPLGIFLKDHVLVK